MKLIDRLTSRNVESRYSLSDLLGMLETYSFNGHTYPIVQTFSPTEKIERAEQTFTGFAGLYGENAIVFACMAFRASVFAEARFQFQRLRAGRPSDLYGTQALSVLETPWPNGTTGELLVKMLNDVDLAGNFFAAREGDTLYRMRPDWVDVMLDRPGTEYDARPVGYLYWPGGRMGRGPEAATVFRLQDVVHWAPKPDPLACYRGMSPLTSLIREVMTDQQMTVHKESFLRNAATPNMVVTVDPSVSFENFKKFKEDFQDDHEGSANAYKTLFLGSGADVTVVGKDFKELDFKQVQGAGETRIAAAFEVPPVLVGLSEGLQAATYSNYASARRRFADGTARPLWRSAAAALATVVRTPSDSRLWYDDRDVPFLREDAKDDAEIGQMKASTIRTLVEGGFTAESVVHAVDSGDLNALEHTGLTSVQLLPPGQSGDANSSDQPALTSAGSSTTN